MHSAKLHKQICLESVWQEQVEIVTKISLTKGTIT